jgi:hypothetical protein
LTCSQARAELGAALLGGRAPLFSRVHFRVFGAAVRHSAAWTRAVYGSALAWDVPAAVLTLQGEGVEAPVNESVNVSVASWRRFLCRGKLWARYCGADDVALFAAVPPVHAGLGLSREELEAMESAAKAGHVADMERMLRAQHAAQEAALERRRCVSG